MSSKHDQPRTAQALESPEARPRAPLGEVRLAPRPDQRYTPFEPTPLQQSYIFGRTPGAALGGFSAQSYMEFELQTLDLDRVESAIRRLIRRHEMLRAVITPEGQHQILEQVPPFEVERVDLRGASAERVAEATETARAALRDEGPAIETWPLFSVRALQLDDRTRLHVRTSLLVLDGTSLRTVLRDVVRCYRDPDARLEPPGVSYRDYLQALEAHRGSSAHEQARRYWLARLATLPGGPELPLARPPESIARPRFVRHTTSLPPELFRAFSSNAMAAGLMPAIALCAVYCAALARWSRRPHFSLIVLYYNREPVHPEIHEVVGNCSSTLALEVDVSAGRSIAELGAALHRQLIADVKQARFMSAVELARLAGRGADRRGQAISPVVFMASLDPNGSPEIGWLEHLQAGVTQTPFIWIEGQALQDGERGVLNWDVVEDLFPPGMIERCFAAFAEKVRHLCAAPEAWHAPLCSGAPLAPPVSRGAAAPLPADTLHQRVAAQAARAPGRTAVISEGKHLTYGELWALAVESAAWLRERGACPNSLVPVVMEKGWEQIVAVLGILLSGAAYLPVDAGLPLQRVHHLLAQSDRQLILTQRSIAERLEWPQGSQLLCVDQLPGQARGASAALLPEVVVGPEDLAYVIFTSGSTGAPKGVMIDHRGALNTIEDINARLELRPEDRILGISSLSFDLSVYDIFGALVAGAALVVPPPSTARRPDVVEALLARHAVTIWSSVPALMQLLVEHAESAGRGLPAALRAVLLSGDWIPVQLPDRVRALAPTARVIGLGGATEASIWSVVYPIDAVDPGWSSIPYGRAMTNQALYVLDEDLRSRPTWVPGEIYIGGAGVAKGYWAHPSLTAERFIHHPSGERLYRTGDLGRFLPDGNIEFLGREDAQVKIQGYRIELGEIERDLERHPDVTAAAVAARGEERGAKILVAYLVLAPASTGDVDEVRAWLAARLPAYMVPAIFIALDRLPLTGNGKVDRKALPEPGATAVGRSGAAHVEPRTQLERELATIWAELLGVERVGVRSDFFVLGGHSLTALRMLTRIRGRYGVHLPLSSLFDEPTIEAQARAIQRPGGAPRSPLVALRPQGSEPPLFLIHPVGGNVLCYAPLAAELRASLPVFALQSPSRAPNLDRIEGMAAEYLTVIRAARPRGPYRLAGWSLGGVVALEMAAQLRAAGEAVDALILIDSLVNSEPGAARIEDDEAAMLAWFLGDLSSSSAGVRERAAALRASPEGARLAVALRGAQRDGTLPAEVQLEELREMLEIFSRNARALLRYRVPRYPHPIHLLYAEERSAVGAGWPAGATPSLEVHRIPGNHYTILGVENARLVADQINRIIPPPAPSETTLTASEPRSLVRVVHRALDFLARRQLPDGCITDSGENHILGLWDSVHALRAHASWQDVLESRHRDVMERVRLFLRERETPQGLISWGDREPGDYSTETSSEYIKALFDLGHHSEAREKAEVLRQQQLPSGAWREHHRHIPEVFQTMPSVTAFALRALGTVGLEPKHEAEAVACLLAQQHGEGHWGYNWYYNATPYYVTMPVTAVLAEFNAYGPLAKVRKYVLERQRKDGGWFFDMEDVTGAYQKQLSGAAHTAYAIETLASCGVAPDAAPIRRAIDWLLAEQRADGSWFGGTFPYPPSEQYERFTTTQDAYTTAAVAVVLRRVADLGAEG